MPPMIKKLLFLLLLPLFMVDASPIFGQAKPATFGHADSLRGTLGPFRSNYDVTFYDLETKLLYETKSIEGKNSINFTALKDLQVIQIDLFSELEIDSIVQGKRALTFKRDGAAIFVSFYETIKAGSQAKITVFYHGKPIIAKKPPWDGGLVWSKDKSGKPWVAVACEGIGASLWWPLKDHLSDEPDSLRHTIVLPPGPLNNLQAVGNGQQGKVSTREDGGKAYEWFVSYPINSYNVTFNVADYAHIHDVYTNESGDHDLDYYVLSANKAEAEKHFQQVKPMMDCYEKLFGEYPFWRDGYALVETPYWGMEHQGAVAYGNGYKNNSWGWDYIIIHETGHEWWGNHVSCEDHAELWIHESFCTYGEALYVECTTDYETSVKYLKSQRGNILNGSPIVGPREVNFNNWIDSDMYYKGAWMLHTLRHVINNDPQWFEIIREIQKEFGMKTTSTAELTAFISKKAGLDLDWFFSQYLYHNEAPVLEYNLTGKVLRYRWNSSEKNFKMKIGARLDEKEYLMLDPTTEWQEIKLAKKPKYFLGDLDSWYFLVKPI